MKLIIALAAGMIAAVLAAPAFAQEPAPPTTNPFPGKTRELLLYVDTVTASPGESKYGVSYPKRCTQLNLMRRGEGIVFRMWAVDTATGKVLEDTDLKYAYVKIPGVQNLKMRYSPHGRDPDAPWFWAIRWDVPPEYPLGLVDFRVVVRTKKTATTRSKLGIFAQPNVFGALQLGKLEIVESRPVETA